MIKGKYVNVGRSALAICALFLIVLGTMACQGQEETSVREAVAIHVSIASLADSLVRPADPFFYLDGQLCQHVRRIHQDRQGNLWFGTNVYGLLWYDGDTLRYLDEKDGLGGGRITAIVEDEDGQVWFGTYQGLTKYDGSTFKNYQAEDKAISNSIWSVHLDQKGVFWLGTDEGVVRFDRQTFTAFPIPQIAVEDTTSIVSYRRISRILEDRQGTLWFGTDGFGICTYDGESFGRITQKDGLPDNNVHDLMEDSRGNIWIGTMYGGISLYDGESFTNLTAEGVVEGVEAGRFYEDPAGNIWLAAENVGVYRYDGTSFTLFNKEDGLDTGGVLAFYQDRENRFWLGGWGGLFRFYGDTFVSVTKDGPWGE